MGRPKKYIDIYNTGSNGVDLSQLEQLMEQNKRGNEGINWNAVKYRINPKNWDNKNWDNEKEDNKKEDKGPNWNAIKYNLNTIQSKMNLRNWGGREKKPKKQYGGYLNQYGPGGINDYNPNFVPDLGKVDLPNPFASTKENPYVNPLTGKSSAVVYNSQTGGYDETTRSQNASLANTPSNESKLVGIENKINKNVDLEAGVNKFNATASGLMNLFDPNKKRQCGPGTVWNSGTRTCEATNSMDLMAAEDQQDRGDWQDFGHKAGMFEYDKEGSDRNSRATYGQYGGYMQEGGSSSIEEYEKSSEHQDMLKRYHEKQAAGRTMETSNSSATPTYMVYDKNGELIYTTKNKAAAEKVLKGGPIISQNFQYGGSFEEDEEVYMSPEELEQFLQSGGQVEYL